MIVGYPIVVWTCNCGFKNPEDNVIVCGSCGMKKKVSVEQINYGYRYESRPGAEEVFSNVKFENVGVISEIINKRKEARDILVKHIGVGGEGTFVSCGTDKLVDAIVEALEKK